MPGWVAKYGSGISLVSQASPSKKQAAAEAANKAAADAAAKAAAAFVDGLNAAPEETVIVEPEVLPPVPTPSVTILSEEQVDCRLNGLLDEYLIINDIKEVHQSLEELRARVAAPPSIYARATRACLQRVINENSSPARLLLEKLMHGWLIGKPPLLPFSEAAKEFLDASCALGDIMVRYDA